jgi:hypothetical protein
MAAEKERSRGLPWSDTRTCERYSAVGQLVWEPKAKSIGDDMLSKVKPETVEDV